MLTTWIAAILRRDLGALRREIEAYADERDIWRVAPGIRNCAGTLAPRRGGNTPFFVGAVLAGTGYVRDRDAEFARRDVPRAELLREIDAAIAAVERGMARLAEAGLKEPDPQPPAGFAVTTRDFLLHVVAHLTYHLCHVDFQRRPLTRQAGPNPAASPGEIATALPAAPR